MKNKLLRLLSLCLLATLLVGAALPALAATKKPTMSVYGNALYVGLGKTVLDVDNMPEGAKYKSITSSDKKVLKVGRDDGFVGFGGLWVKPLKAGKSKVTINYTCNGKSLKLTRTFTVKKYHNAFSWIKVNGKKVDLKKNRTRVILEKYKKTGATITFKLKDGWKVTACKGTDLTEWKDFTWKNGKSFKIPALDSVDAFIWFKNKKTGEKYNYEIMFLR